MLQTRCSDTLLCSVGSQPGFVLNLFAKIKAFVIIKLLFIKKSVYDAIVSTLDV